MQTQLDNLGVALEVGLEPGQRCSCNTVLGLQSFGYSTVVDCGKRW